MTRLAARLLIAFIGASFLVVTPASPALARCEGTVSAVRPDGTPVGWFVSPPKVDEGDEYPAGDPLADQAVSWSDTYGYGAKWNTYDLGCGPDAARDPLALAFNAMANLVAEGAKFPIAAISQTQTWLTDNPFDWLGDYLASITEPIKDRVWLKFFPLSLIVLGLVFIWQSRRADVSAAMSAAGWSLVVLTVCVFFLQYPQKAATTLTSIVQSGASVASAPFDQGGFSDTLSRHIIYPQWLQGELGSTSSAVAEKYGEDLYRAQHYTWREAEIIDRAGEIRYPGSPEFDADDQAALDLQQSKQDDFDELADKIQRSDRDAYNNLQGKNGVNRLAAAFIMGIYTWTASIFMGLALAILALALLMVFAVIIGAPLAGIVGLHDRFRHVFKGILNMFVASLVGVVKLTLGAGVFSVVVGAIVAAPGNQALKLLLTIIATVVALMVVRPIKTFKTVLPGIDPHTSYLKQAADYALHRKAVEDGIEHHRPTRTPPDGVEGEGHVSSTRLEQPSMDPIPDHESARTASPSLFSSDPELARSGGIPPAFAVTGQLVGAQSAAVHSAPSGARAAGGTTASDSEVPKAARTAPTSLWDVNEPLYTKGTARHSSVVDDLPIADAQIGADGEQVFVLYRTKQDPYEISAADLTPSAPSVDQLDPR